jgi:hypothetical protein
MDFKTLNENKYFAGVALIALNLGARYLAADLGKFHETILNNDLVKRFVLFSLFFVATRDVIIALTLTLIFSILVYGFLHERSRFSLVPDAARVSERMERYYRI